MSNQQPKPYVVFHDSCMDGFGAAYAAWLKFGDDARYTGAHYQSTVPQFRARADIYMVDFSYPRDVLLELAKNHPKIVVLDHHKTAEEALRGISEEAPNIEVVFDMKKSGAVLAWEYFHPGERIPDLLLHVQDRDLWEWKLVGTREIMSVVNSHPQEFDVWKALMSTPVSTLLYEGMALARMQQKHVEGLLGSARALRIGHFIVPAVNAPYFVASDLGNQLLTKYPQASFSAVYRDAADGQRHWSLRSMDDRADVSRIAKWFGGGGHRNAAGFATYPDEEGLAFDPMSFDDLLKAQGLV